MVEIKIRRYRLYAGLIALVALLAVWPATIAARGDSTPPAPVAVGAQSVPGDVPQRYLGEWKGVASAGVHRFDVALDVTGGSFGAEIGRSYLAVSDCRFALVLVRADTAALVAHGRLLRDGNQACAERQITLTPAGDGGMTYIDSRAGAAGTLRRVS
jgi:hypothetical protein